MKTVQNVRFQGVRRIDYKDKKTGEAKYFFMASVYEGGDTFKFPCDESLIEELKQLPELARIAIELTKNPFNSNDSITAFQATK
jgi:hypothetical protein